MRICIGTISRNRRIGFERLVESYCKMIVPDLVELVFAVVENNDIETLSDLVSPLSSYGKIVYELEPELGIPFARNAVLNISKREKCDFTTFVDDDETVDIHWLEKLYHEIQSRKLDLVGGPVKLRACAQGASWLNKTMWRGLVWQKHRATNIALNKYDDGTDNKITVITNNWIIRNSFLKRNNMQFDETLGFSGGSDTAFCRAAWTKGAITGWAPEAYVFETLPLSRLSVHYQFQRGRDQTLASFRQKHPTFGSKELLKSLAFVFVKFLTGLVLLAVSPLNNFLTLTSAIHKFGMAHGRLKAVFSNRQSTHYEIVHSA